MTSRVHVNTKELPRYDHPEVDPLLRSWIEPALLEHRQHIPPELVPPDTYLVWSTYRPAIQLTRRQPLIYSAATVAAGYFMRLGTAASNCRWHSLQDSTFEQELNTRAERAAYDWFCPGFRYYADFGYPDDTIRDEAIMRVRRSSQLGPLRTEGRESVTYAAPRRLNSISHELHDVFHVRMDPVFDIGGLYRFLRAPDVFQRDLPPPVSVQGRDDAGVSRLQHIEALQEIVTLRRPVHWSLHGQAAPSFHLHDALAVLRRFGYFPRGTGLPSDPTDRILLIHLLTQAIRGLLGRPAGDYALAAQLARMEGRPPAENERGG